MTQSALRLVKAGQPSSIITTPSGLELALDEWNLYLEADDYAELTVRHYRWHVEKFVTWLAGRRCAAPEQISGKLVRAWAVSLKKEKGWSPSTRKQGITAVRNFLRWCWEERLAPDDLSDKLKVPTEKIRPQRTVTRQELHQLIAACPDDPIGWRNAAIMSLLFDSGLRSQELCRLRVCEVDLEKRELSVQIKGGNTMPGWFGVATVARLERWYSVRAAWPGVETVFVGIGGTTPGRPMTPDGLRGVLRKHGEQAGVPSLNTHAFRRGFAVALSAAGKSDNVLKDLGRWSNTQMIKRYTLAQQVRHLYSSPVDSD